MKKRFILPMLMPFFLFLSCNEVLVTSYPAEAQFTYRNKEYLTPAKIRVSSMNQEIELIFEKEGFQTFIFQGRPTEQIHSRLEPITYPLILNCNTVFAEISINGRKIDKDSPQELPEGEYLIEITSPYHHPLSDTIELRDALERSYTLEAYPARVSYDGLSDVNFVLINQIPLKNVLFLNQGESLQVRYQDAFGTFDFSFLATKESLNITPIIQSFQLAHLFRETGEDRYLENATYKNRNILSMADFLKVDNQESPLIFDDTNVKEPEEAQSPSILQWTVTGATYEEVKDHLYQSEKSNDLYYEPALFLNQGLHLFNGDFSQSDHLILETWADDRLMESREIHPEDVASGTRLSIQIKTLPPFENIRWKWDLKDSQGNVLDNASYRENRPEFQIQGYPHRMEHPSDEINRQSNQNEAFLYYSGNPQYLLIGKIMTSGNFRLVGIYDISQAEQPIKIKTIEDAQGAYVATVSMDPYFPSYPSLFVSNEEYIFDAQNPSLELPHYEGLMMR